MRPEPGVALSLLGIGARADRIPDGAGPEGEAGGLRASRAMRAQGGEGDGDAGKETLGGAPTRGHAMSSPSLEVRAATAAEWDDAWAGCRHSTYFQSRGWAECWSEYTKGVVKPDPVSIRIGRGQRIIMPMSRQRRHAGLSSRRLLSPAGGYGGCLAGEPLSAEEARAVLCWMDRAKAPYWWRLSPFDPALAELQEHGRSDTTQAIDLGGGPKSACERASHGHASAVRKACRRGLAVRRAGSPEEWEAYYRIYEASLIRWGASETSRYGESLFEALRRRGSPDVELWLAVLDEETIVAGGLCLYGPRHVSYWHAAALSEFFELRPANLLVHELLLDACGRSLEWFDLNPSAGLEGVQTFKQRVGAVTLPSPVIVREGGRDAALGCVARLVKGSRQKHA